MESIEAIQARIQAAVPGARVELLSNGSPSAEHSLVVDREHGRAVAEFLRDDPELQLDYCSNATGVDWPERVLTEKIKVKQVVDGVDGVEKEVEETKETRTPAYLEAVYHLYSMAKKHGPVILRLRTGDRADDVTLPSLTPVWRSCEFQEREIFDLYGIRFEGHPDLRRILMWDEFKDFPMRRDYVEPDDYEYEPTPHDDVIDKAARHYPKEAAK
jgi:NADH-quinone oxidoreductase subunit C